MKQYIPLKRSRFGIKVFELCEHGYVWNFLVYQGTGGELAIGYGDMASVPKSACIVMTLARHLLGQGYCIWIDRFYSSPDLFAELQSRQTEASILHVRHQQCTDICC